ncbi:hypothetical protein GOP47_0013854 [Adiantum capillus-veneris]|uniref:Uncharacterized protein n=1 Tax=Adiantum capillus-veneris TaxID=13818 RepID=A0A9D4ZDM1_ADICA|nr:hypothetical protein GOP47_0013854 [Adiantum capillus-veneris]
MVFKEFGGGLCIHEYHAHILKKRRGVEHGGQLAPSPGEQIANGESFVAVKGGGEVDKTIGEVNRDMVLIADGEGGEHEEPRGARGRGGRDKGDEGEPFGVEGAAMKPRDDGHVGYDVLQ